MAELLRDRYELLEVGGQGGEGRVLRALDHQHGRIVALKLRKVGAPGDREELLSEARILLALPPHPNLPVVREDFFDGGQYVIAMDWVEGTDLSRLVRAKGRPGLAPSMVMGWLADAAAALTHLHTQTPAIVHGDVKPSNLILSRGGRVTLVDFGLSSSPSSRRKRGGTWGYAAPELAVRGEPSRRSDVYSLAATAFALLTGGPPTGIRPPWDGIDPAQATELEEAIRAGLATDPERRPATPGELVELLRAGFGATLPSGVLTFCVTDVDGSAALWDANPVEMARALVAHDQLIASEVEAAGGRFVKSMGDGDATVSVFSAPGAAIVAALAVARAGPPERVGAEALRPRVALHTGEAEPRGADYVGPTLAVATRLRSLAGGGQVLLSRATADLVGRHLPAGVTLVDLGPHRLRERQEVEPAYALAAPGVVAPPATTECPYPGLLSFGADDADRFFGREDVVADLAGRLGRDRFVAVVGGSGSGKSSLLRAGLGPAMGGADVVTPGPHPVAAVAGLAGGDRLLVVDQFEEVFTTCEAEDERAAFFDLLLDRPGPVALGIRADFYGACANHAGLAAAVAQSHLLLGPMTDRELRRAILEPARLGGLRLAPGLVEVFVGEVAGEPGALPLLSHALRATWETRENRTLTLEGYRGTGGVRGAIAATADTAVANLDAPDRDLARRLFLRLVEPHEDTEDTRRRAALSELTPAGEGADRVAVVLDRLAAARLVTVDAGGVEVAHEALIREWPQLRAWLDEGREGLRVQRHVTAAAASWDALNRDPGELYRGPRLAAALDWLGREPHLSVLERDFLTASQAEDERVARARLAANRRLRILFAGVAVGLVVALVAGSVAFVQGRRAASARDRADVARLAAVSQSVVERQPDVGLLLAAESYRRDPGVEAGNALLSGLEAHPLLEGLLYGVDSGLEAAAFTPDGTLLATPTSDGTGTLLWDTATRQQVAALRHGDDLAFGAAVSPDGRWLAVPSLDEDGNDIFPRLQVWDLPGRRLATVVDSPGGVLTSASFSADGRTLVTQGGPVTTGPPPTLAVVWDTATWTPAGPPLRLAEDYLDDDVIAVSPDGDLVALPRADGTVAVWAVAERRQVATLAPDVSYVTTLAFSPDGGTLAVTGGGRPRRPARPADRGGRGPPLVLPGGEPSAVEFSPDGHLLAVGSEEGGSQLFDLPTGEALGPPLAANASGINDVTFSPDGTRLATAGLDRTGALWRIDGHRSIGAAQADHSAAVTEVHYTPDGRRLVSAGSDGKVVVRDVAENRVVRVLDVGGEVLTVALDAEGRRAAVGGTVGPVRVFDLETGSPVAELDVGEAWVHQVAFSPQGELAVAKENVRASGVSGELGGDDPGHVVIWDPRTGGQRGPFTGPRQGFPLAVAWRPDGGQLAVVMENNLVIVFDTRSGQPVGDLIENVDAPMAAVAFSPDGRRLATGSLSGLVQQWSTDTHEPLGPALEGHTGAVLGVAYSPDGRLLASTTLGFGTTRLWDSRTGASVGGELTSGRTPFTVRNFLVEHYLGSRPAFSPDGLQLATPGFDGLTTVWDLRPERWLEAACTLVSRQLTEAEWAQYVSPNGGPAPCGTDA